MSTSEGILASIFDGFGWILGIKLGGKTDQKSIKKYIAKMMLNKMRLEGVLEASWALDGLTGERGNLSGGSPPRTSIHVD